MSNYNLTGGQTQAGTSGDDVFSVTGDGNTASGSGGNDFISFKGNNNLLQGGGADDVISQNGPANANILDGGAGDDILGGGIGNTYIGGIGVDRLNLGMTNFTSAVTVDLSGLSGGGTVVLAGNTSITGIEHIGLTTGSGADVISLGDVSGFANGAGGDDTITGSQSNDFLMGGLGNDTLNAGNGNDGLDGGAGNDVFNGGGGVDTLIYYGATNAVTVDLAKAKPQDTGAAGVDTIRFVENVIGSIFGDTLSGDGGDNVIRGSGDGTGLVGPLYQSTPQGVDGDDVLNGRDGNDTLIGGLGDDTLNGGNGDDVMIGSPDTVPQDQDHDTVTYVDATAAVTVNLGLDTAQDTGGSGMDTLVAIDGVIGSAFDDTLTGGAGTEAAYFLEGGAGNDTLIAGRGLAAAVYEHATAAVTVSLDVVGPQDTGGAGVDTLVGVQALVGSRFGDVLIGGNGDDHFLGGPGKDTMSGGAGSDWVHYSLSGSDPFGATAGVTVDLSMTKLQDTVGAGKDLLISIENVEGTRYADRITGNLADNILVGNGGDDIMSGGGGNDTLIAGAGNNTLSGGGGNDLFVFDGDSFMNPDPGRHAVITDLSDTKDKIDISQIDADVNTAGDQAFTIVGAFSGHAGEATLAYDSGLGATALALDTDGNGTADFTIYIQGDHHTFSGIVL